MNQVIKYFFLFSLLIFILFPIFQQNCRYFKIKPLGGAYTKKEIEFFNLSNWFEGSFQKNIEEYENENFGFRNSLVRLNNQIDFSFFRRSHAEAVIIGKNGYCYEKQYIDAYYGNDFVGNDKITEYIKKLKQVQDSLEKKGKLFIFVFASGKATFYPEYIPEKLKTKKKLSNYDALLENIKTLGLNYIDFNSYFLSQKEKSKYPLYPQYGIHWSNYGAVKAFDSITSYIEHKLHVNLPDIKISSIEQPDTLRSSDNDLVKGMNLLWQPKTFKMAYPVFTVFYDSLVHKKLNSIVVADSYWWQIYGNGLHTNTFKMNNFWYYNKEVHPDSWVSTVYVNQINYSKRLRKADVIIVLYTEANLHRLGDGFSDLCIETFCQKPDTVKEHIHDITETIVKTEKWYNDVKEKAKKFNIPLDTMLWKDAEWYYNELVLKRKH